jgi:hypothetical protein
MKLLEPFSGYSLANGISIFHLSLFISSFSVFKFSDMSATPSIDGAFRQLRISHIAVTLLQSIGAWAMRKKPQSTDGDDDDAKDAGVELTEEE